MRSAGGRIYQYASQGKGKCRSAGRDCNPCQHPDKRTGEEGPGFLFSGRHRSLSEYPVKAGWNAVSYTHLGLLPVLLEHKNGVRWEREQMAEDKMRPNQGQGEIVIYQAEDGLTKVECRFVDETVWLTQQQMAELFHTSRSNIVAVSYTHLWSAVPISGCSIPSVNP